MATRSTYQLRASATCPGRLPDRLHDPRHRPVPIATGAPRDRRRRRTAGSVLEVHAAFPPSWSSYLRQAQVTASTTRRTTSAIPTRAFLTTGRGPHRDRALAGLGRPPRQERRPRRGDPGRRIDRRPTTPTSTRQRRAASQPITRDPGAVEEFDQLGQGHRELRPQERDPGGLNHPTLAVRLSDGNVADQPTRATTA